MRTTDKNSLNYILQHKEYFDQKLIAIVENLKSHNGKLIEDREYLRHQYHNQKLTISHLHLKIKDLDNQKYAVNKKYLDTKKDKDEIFGHLQNSEKELVKAREEIERLLKTKNLMTGLICQEFREHVICGSFKI